MSVDRRTVDRRIEEAVELGHKNERAISLLANHCVHARVEMTGGNGLVAQVLLAPR